jgi:hypothetical protein
MWEDMQVVVRALFPGLMLLRLADKSEPSMDKLYIYIRRMDIALERSWVLLNQVEDHYTGGSTGDSGHILRNRAKYFLRNEKDIADVENEFKYSRYDSDEGDSDSDVSSIESTNEADPNSDSDDSTVTSTKELEKENNRLGNKMIVFWNAGKKINFGCCYYSMDGKPITRHNAGCSKPRRRTQECS